MTVIKITDFSSGMLELNVNLAPANSVGIGMNGDFDVEIGSFVSRLGTDLIGGQLVDNKPILGLHQHIDTVTPANNLLFGVIADGTNSDIYDVVAGTKSLADDTKDLKTRFLTYLGATLRLNGTDAEKSYTSAGWIATAGAFDLANIPGANKNKYPIEFLDRVYLAGDTANPTRLYYSGVSDGSTVSWTVDNGYVDIEPEDGGGAIKGLGKVPGYILVFKERSLHRWNYNSAFPESLISIGTPSHESIIMGGGLCAFYSNSNEGARGFYITNGSRPVCITQDNNRPIKKWIDAIASSNEANISGWATDRHFNWSVGDLTVDGETYSNVVFRYNRILNQWSIRTYQTDFKFFTNYLLSGVNTTVGGDDDGTVYRLDTTDKFSDDLLSAEKEIPYRLRTHHNNYGDNKIKTITDKVVVRGKNINDARVSAYVNEVLDPISVNGQGFLNNVLSILGINKVIKGNTIALEVAGESKGARAYIRELEVNIELSKNHNA